MAIYLVAYELSQEGRNADCLEDKLEGYRTHWRMQPSAWLIQTLQSASKIHEDLNTCLEANDKLFVARLSRDAAWGSSYESEVDAWLHENL